MIKLKCCVDNLLSFLVIVTHRLVKAKYLHVHSFLFDIHILTHPPYADIVQDQYDQLFLPLLPAFTDVLAALDENDKRRIQGRSFPLHVDTVDLWRKAYKQWHQTMQRTAIDINPDIILVNEHAVNAGALHLVDKQLLANKILLITSSPMMPTKYLAPPHAGYGQLRLFRFLNQFAWKQIKKSFYDAVQDIIETSVFPTPSDSLSWSSLRDENVLLHMMFSDWLLETPKDYTSNEKAIGPVIEPPDQYASRSIPKHVFEFIGSAVLDTVPIVYVDFGELFWTGLSEQQRTDTMNALVAGSLLASKKAPSRMIIQLRDDFSISLPPEAVSSILLATDTIPHGMIFDKCTIIIHGGDPFVINSALLAGRPNTGLPVYQKSEFGFWSDVLVRKHISPFSFPLVKSSTGLFRQLFERSVSGDEYERHTFEALDIQTAIRLNTMEALESIDDVCRKKTGMKKRAVFGISREAEEEWAKTKEIFK